MASSSLALVATLVVLLSAVLPLHVFASSGGFSIELIHRDSIKSPYYNSSATHFDQIRAASHRSVYRAARISLLNALSASSPGFQSQLIPNSAEYLMTLTLGTPAVERLLIADTGSDIIWTQCKPCSNCYKQDAPLFDPAKSSTYKNVSCQSSTCQSIENTDCSSDNTCLFSIRYGDNSYTNGALSVETFGFDSSTDSSAKVIQAAGGVSITNLVFGCANEADGTFDSKSSGLVGLGGGSGSLITQLSSSIDGKFSYCMVPYSNSDSSASSVLRFGDKAVVTEDGAVSTPLISGEQATFYYVTLEDITVGSGSNESEKIEVKRTGAAAGGTGNVIVDSGTTLTLLDEDTVSSLEKQVSKVVKLPTAKPQGDLFRLCYDATNSTSDSDLPDITFKYTGASLKLSPLNTFVSPEEGIICLAILPNQGLGISIIGNIAQQNFHVGYDLNAKTLTFAPANCASS